MNMKNLEILEEFLNESKQKQKNLKKNSWISDLFSKKEKDPRKLLKKLP
jgi:hypothetical protein